MLRHILCRIDNLLQTNVSYDGNGESIKTEEISQTIIRKNIFKVSDIIYYGVERIMDKFIKTTFHAGKANQEAIIKSFIVSNLNGSTYPSDDSEIKRVNVFFTQEKQIEINTASRTFIETLKNNLKEAIQTTLNVLYENVKPFEHEQRFLFLVHDRFCTFLNDDFKLENFQKFINELEIERPQIPARP